MKRRQFLAVTVATLAAAARRVETEQVGGAVPTSESARSWLARLPKVELHLHIEGAIPKTALWQLVTKYGGDPSVPSFEAFEQRLEFRGLKQFFSAFDWATGFLRDTDDFTFVGREIARDLVRQNIRYVEAHFSPTVFRQRLDPQRIAEALRKGLDEVSSVDVALIAELGRNLGPDAAMRTLERIGELRSSRIVGIGLGGFEPQYPNELFATVYEQARTFGLRTTAHAGESAGPASVWSAIRALRVDRIGHATRAIEDAELVRYLGMQRIPLELCPESNLRTGVVATMASHPIRRYFDAGIPVSVNTDDPLFFGNSLVSEMVAAQQTHRFTRDEIKRLIVSAVEASWLTRDARERLLKAFRAESVWNEGA
jgi:adenosine deaminase